MEYTGRYYLPIARYLQSAGIFASAAHAKLTHDYGNNTIRKVKTDKADAVKIANYALDRWMFLKPLAPEDDIRLLLKTCNRQYMKLKLSLKNCLVAILDQTFPGVNTMFSSPARTDGSEKRVDFAEHFWHCEIVSSVSRAKFTEQYNKWCHKHGYNRSDSKAAELHDLARKQITTLPATPETKVLVSQAVSQLNCISTTLAATRQEMQRLASSLPEYPVVLAMSGVGEILGPQTMAEIGDVQRFERRQSLAAFAGVDAPPYQSGSFESQKRHISKRDPPRLRKTLFQVMNTILQHAPSDNLVYQFPDRKLAEGKHYYVYMTAGANKFLRIYYGTVKAYLQQVDR